MEQRLFTLVMTVVVIWGRASALVTDYADYPFPSHMDTIPSIGIFAIDRFIPPAYDSHGKIVGCEWYPFATKYAPAGDTPTVNGTVSCRIDTYNRIKELAAANPNTEPKAFVCYNFFRYYLDANNPEAELCCVGCFIHNEYYPPGGSSARSHGVPSRGSAMAAAFAGVAAVAAQWLLLIAAP